MDMTPREYLTFVLGAKGVKKKDWEGQLANAMEKTDIAHMQHRLIRNLSKGYRQRVGIAQALLGDPEIIILDEPTVGLDPRQIIEIRTLIRELGKDHTVILSSHILSEVQSVCDKVLIMANGKLQAGDTTENLSRLLSGQARLHLTVKKEMQERAAALLSALPCRETVSCTELENGEVLFTLIPGEEDLREQIFRLFAQNDVALLEMHTRQATLEDVFLKLTDSTEVEEEEKA